MYVYIGGYIEYLKFTFLVFCYTLYRYMLHSCYYYYYCSTVVSVCSTVKGGILYVVVVVYTRTT